ncbi:MAG: nucleotidyltransferase domain-containing protein [Candidatus Bathyarchaeia archaeon]
MIRSTSQRPAPAKVALESLKEFALAIGKKYGAGIEAIIIYGSRARGDYSFDSDLDALILLDDGTDLETFVQFSAEARMMAHRIGPLKLFICPRGIFKKIMKENEFLGAFCYIICEDGVAIYDPRGTFERMKGEVESMGDEERLSFYERCRRMSEELGSPRWIKYWGEKAERLRRGRSS